MDSTFLTLVAVGAFGLLAAMWMVLRARRRSARGGGTTRLTGLREREFEALVAEAFRAQGYEPLALPRGQSVTFSGLALRRERTTFLVECRHWRAAKVGVDAIHALQKSMAARGATAGFVLSGGRFSREAIAFAASCSVQLIDGPALETMIARVKGR